MEDPEYGASGSPNTTIKRPVKNIHINNTIPSDILQNEALNKAISTLPSNYSFEIHKTLWRTRKSGAKRIALQFPEGLLMYSCIISDILQTFGSLETVILGDVTYGACCIDDLSAIALGCDFLVHYGHSCLVPIDICQIPTLYVFVDIFFNSDHLISMLLKHLDPENTHLILAGTIQFSSTIQSTHRIIKSRFKSVTVPQAKPLSQGEVLGCTSPKLTINGGISNPTSTLGQQKLSNQSKQQQQCCSSNTTTCGGDKKIQSKESKESKKQIRSTESIISVEDIEGNLGHGATPDGIALEESDINADTHILQSQEEEKCCGNNNPSCCENNNQEEEEQITNQLLPLPPKEATPQDNIVCVFLADGRFHLESLMIQNPHIPRFLRYDPYNRMLTEESYDYEGMHKRRYAAIQTAKTAKKWGVILGTLGRQGSTHILTRIETCLKKHNFEFIPILLSEIFPSKLSILSTQCDAWVQIACPRLSVDWASGFSQPLLSPYEFFVCVSELDQEAAAIATNNNTNDNTNISEEPKSDTTTTTTTTTTAIQTESTPPTPLAPTPLTPILATKTEWLPNGVYPMDYYSSNGGEWTNYYHRQIGQPDVIGGFDESSENLNQGGGGDSTKKKISGKEALALLRAKRAKAKQDAEISSTSHSSALGVNDNVGQPTPISTTDIIASVQKAREEQERNVAIKTGNADAMD